jgi:ketosteroid isomerase-like protein
MTFHELHAVVLQRDLPDLGLRPGDLGAVVRVHDEDMLDVEFVRLSGQTQAVVQLALADVRPVEDADLAQLAGYRISVYREQPEGRWLLARDAHTLSTVEK